MHHRYPSANVPQVDHRRMMYVENASQMHWNALGDGSGSQCRYQSASWRMLLTAEGERVAADLACPRWVVESGAWDVLTTDVM